MKSILLTIFLISTYTVVYAQSFEERNFNCFSILIGRQATQDSSVMLAHNEDDYGKRVVNWYNVPQKSHSETDKITLKRGGEISQVSKINAYLWLEIPELEFSDSYFSTKGIIIASDACSSREDSAEIIDGGIGYWLRRLIIERSNTAREAVQIAGQIIDSVGYASSGRTYSIADANEAWMLSVVKGKHWVAQRIPDNQIAIIPNYYTINKVNLEDTVNFLASKDLITYATKRGWYVPEKDGEFNFRRAYSNQANLKSMGNIGRHWASLNMLSEKQYELNQEFPFSFIPKKRLQLSDVFKVLRNHYEGTELDETDNYRKGNPHKQKIMSVCSNTNMYGFVAQLRNYMPVEIGSVLWLAPRRPCTQSFIPIYSCINIIPENFRFTDAENALKTHFDKIEDFDKYSQNHAYQVFNVEVNTMDSTYSSINPKLMTKNEEFEQSLFQKQTDLETKMLNLYSSNPRMVRKTLSKYSIKLLINKVEKY